MKRYAVVVVLVFIIAMVGCALAASRAVAQPRANEYPIVLLHGMGGFGRDEGDGVLYWGGWSHDIQSELQEAGYETYTLDLGPLSSNWDRACEAYAQLLGGTVDYGAAHAARYGHARYGRTYPGLYPEWGQTSDDEGRINKIHIIAHSMGGQTMRVLIQLMEKGCAEEADASPDNVSPLFVGGKSWVSGAMSISGPHDGSSLEYALPGGIPQFQQLAASMYLAGPGLSRADLKLDQWGLGTDSEEIPTLYWMRIVSNQGWQNTTDSAAWDVSVDGARCLNGWVAALSDVYYFSWATLATARDQGSGVQVPISSMHDCLMETSRFIGSCTHWGPWDEEIDDSWWPNDGMVPFISQDGPSVNSSDIIVSHDTGAVLSGQWNYLGVLDGIDHLDVIGMTSEWDPDDFYLKQAALLASLDN